MSNTKLEITEAVFKELPEHSKHRSFTVEQSMFKWWVSGRGGQSLRLKDDGYEAFTEANIDTSINVLSATILLKSIAPESGVCMGSSANEYV